MDKYEPLYEEKGTVEFSIPEYPAPSFEDVESEHNEPLCMPTEEPPIPTPSFEEEDIDWDNIPDDMKVSPEELEELDKRGDDFLYAEIDKFQAKMDALRDSKDPCEALEGIRKEIKAPEAGAPNPISNYFEQIKADKFDSALRRLIRNMIDDAWNAALEAYGLEGAVRLFDEAIRNRNA